MCAGASGLNTNGCVGAPDLLEHGAVRVQLHRARMAVRRRGGIPGTRIRGPHRRPVWFAENLQNAYLNTVVSCSKSTTRRTGCNPSNATQAAVPCSSMGLAQLGSSTTSASCPYLCPWIGVSTTWIGSLETPRHAVEALTTGQGAVRDWLRPQGRRTQDPERHWLWRGACR